MAHAPPPDDEARALLVRAEAAEAKAAELDEWLEVAFAGSFMGVGVISSLENRYVRVNAALAEIYGMSVDEILNEDPFSMALKLAHPDELVAEQKLFAELVMGARRSYQIEKRFVRRDGTHRLCQLNFSGIFAKPGNPRAAPGTLLYAVIQAVDIREQRALKETLAQRETELRHAQKIDGIGRLAAGIAHDFNNLLTVIMGHGEVLKGVLNERSEAVSGSEPQPDLEAILAASERAAALTAQLLTHGRRDTVVLSTFVLSDAVATLQRLLSRVLGSNIQVKQSLAAAGAIHADQGQIGQVVMNLMLNARDAITELGHIRLSTRDVGVAAGEPEAAPGPGEWVALDVSDSGHGMTPEVQAHMFEPFFTTRPDRPGTQGTGLGLATVQRIVAELGGHIRVTSALDEGTTVTVFFPRVALAAKEVERAPRVERLLAAPNSRRVLVVEDEPSVRALLGNVLLGAHYWVTVARNGEEALRFIDTETEPFHLVVTDLVMPSVGGRALAKALAERGSATRVLFISGYSQHTAGDLLQFGTLLAKPFTPAQLLAAVRNALEGSETAPNH